ncbi:hypothetical protein [Methylibium petroleiphilum]|uniref:Uncharacterized protein n=1 Tax=Methylibium petroleiphilum (strain ATCC BAA-1232 / LMG 22953 / PM1) TaxID=420662 RepID=A2SNI8_METPP|nr:hypothetical protein [Methylibium petroleiphilum]ABM97127.1 hypothetical protein Mpe_B0352 [Methylibium petroleiphilum PM1]
MSATLVPAHVALPFGVIGDTRIAHAVTPEHLRVNGGLYSMARFDLADGRRLFVVSELAENDGPSVTNAAETIATAILSNYASDLEPSQVVFLEHYDDEFSYSFMRAAGRANRVSFDRWEITWQGRRAVFVDWMPVFNSGTH